MSIYDTVSEQMKDAMRSKDKPRLSALRNIRAAFLTAVKEDNADTLPDDKALTILRRLAKQRAESIEAYTAGGRTELAASETAELAVIEGFLPQLADAATTQGWVADAIAKTGATSKRDMGKVMGALMGAHKGQIDGKLANQLVAAALE